jgi:indolepyruvate ferredoxin oxidoreductase
MERRLIADYEADVERLLDALDARRLPLATQIASIPEEVRGFGHVKERNLKAALARRQELLDEYFATQPALLAS